MSGPVIKRCSCGATYDAAAWARLEQIGELSDGVERLGLANCVACHSSIAIVLEVLDPAALAAEQAKEQSCCK